jgi:hypothetical protein
MSFLEDNDPFSKFVFLIVVIFCFSILVNLGMYLTDKMLTVKNPYLIKGMISGNTAYTITQDPALSTSVIVERSNNENGIEFSWSVWINITDVDSSTNLYHHIFHKGELMINPETGVNSPNNAPGMYIAPSTNTLLVTMNTFKIINEEVTIPNMPMNKWVHVVIRVMKNNALDVYVNGALAKRHILSSLPKQNYGNVYVAANGGFTGNLSNLQYFQHALQPSEILALVNKGPNLTSNTDQGALASSPPYLSPSWYTQDL